MERLVPKWAFPALPRVALPNRTNADFEPYPDRPAWNAVCQTYVDAAVPATFLVPVGAFKCIERFMTLSRGRLFVLSGDKGYSHASAFHSLEPPHIARHGSISFMVPSRLFYCDLISYPYRRVWYQCSC